MPRNTKTDDLKGWLSLSQAMYLIRRVREKELSDFGISASQVGVFHAVTAIGQNATPAKISRFLALHPNTVSTLLNKMVNAGLVNKSNDLRRENHIRISITQKGKKIFAATQKSQALKRNFSSLTKDQLVQLISCQRVLSEAALKELGIKDIKYIR